MPTAPTEKTEAVRLMRDAFGMGYTLFDTAEVYSTAEDPHHNERLAGEALKPLRDQVQIVSKFGIHFDQTSPAVNKPLIPDARDHPGQCGGFSPAAADRPYRPLFSAPDRPEQSA